jgi:hypothetical protein
VVAWSRTLIAGERNEILVDTTINFDQVDRWRTGWSGSASWSSVS